MALSSEDIIKPVEIGDSVDEIWSEGRLDQGYNLFDYHFEQGNAYCRARSYVDEMHRVVVYGPFAARNDLRTIEHVATESAVHAYLRRRYRTVESS